LHKQKSCGIILDGGLCHDPPEIENKNKMNIFLKGGHENDLQQEEH
jgi:hypothetical protein